MAAAFGLGRPLDGSLATGPTVLALHEWQAGSLPLRLRRCRCVLMRQRRQGSNVLGMCRPRLDVVTWAAVQADVDAKDGELLTGLFDSTTQVFQRRDGDRLAVAGL